ncbi:MAG: hypothetical protein IIC66_01275, partial [candidate division Zixibacteria bacterium]|nr:hypothetical protein [candidate division Zixibacteria bacterium]
PVLTTSTLPAGASFTDNGNGTGSFDWTPDFLQSGTYNVTFYATDDSSAIDSEIVTITVNDAGNQLPLLAAIGAQSTTENVLLSFGVSASDIESIPTLTTSTLPTGAVFIDNGNGTGSFDWTPTFLQSGSYNITFYATDDSTAVDSEVVTITVNDAGNQLPVLAVIGAQSTTENILLTFGVSATDIESTPVLTTSALPTGAVFTDNGNGTGLFDWTPDFLQSGSYNVTFYATDDSSSVDSELVTITVIDAGNQLPVLSAIGAQSTTENVLLSFGVSATDIESTPVLTTSTLPTGAVFTDNGNGTGTFDWTPDFLQSGAYSVTFYATDDSIAVDSEIVTITIIEAGNQLPVLAAIGAQSTTENVNLSLGVSATDAEGALPTLTTSTLPSGAVFADNGNGTGSFDWTPDFFQSGTYNVTFYATDDSTAVDSEIVTITVNDAGNQLPVLALIGSQSTTENVLLSFGVSATDIESTPTLTTSVLPTGAIFTDNGNGTGSFDWTPDFLQSGSYNVTFYATDDSLSVDSEIVIITVIDGGNQLPILAAIGARSTIENITLSFGVSATDIESTPVLSTSALPAGASFTVNGDGTGSFDWTPTFLQSGSYNVTFYATDDSASVDSEVVTITVSDGGNQLPILASIGGQSTTENVLLSIGISASDIESTPVLTTSTLPTGAVFIDNGNGTGTFDWTPTFLQSGSYSVTFYAADDSTAIDSEIVSITVNEAGNQAPTLAAIGAQSATENVLLSFGVSATDIEGTVSLTTSALPPGAAFTDNGDGSGSFDWTPTFLQSGTYNVTFYATDDSTAIDSEVVTITVNDAGNQLPILAAIGAKSTTENILLNFNISATDIESTPVLTTSSLPNAAIFTDNGNGTASFDWTPLYNQSGVYNITFYATDDSTAIDSEIVVITIIEAGNQPVTLNPIGNQSVSEGINLSFTVSATDPDSTFALMTTSALPSGATYIDNGDGSAIFDWTPDFTQSGSYNITFYATDGISTDSEIININVLESGNQPPTLAAIGDKSLTEGALLSFSVSAVDPDSTIPGLSTSTLPTGALFVNNGDGTGSFDWTPDFTQSGIYNITFYATDGVATDSEQISITVNEAGNQSPVLTAIGAQGVIEGANLNFGVFASDADGTTPILSTSSLPTGAVFVDSGNGSGSFDWTPSFTQSGVYIVTFYATDGSATDSEIVTISVVEEGNQSPVLALIGAQSITEGINLNFGVSASDPDSTIPSLTTSSLPIGATFSDNADGTGVFDWTPEFVQSGSYNITFYASDGVEIDSETIVITVNEAGNQEPVMATIGAQSTIEGLNLNFVVSVIDPDSTFLTLTTSSLPSGASFTDNGDGTGTFDWTPTFTQSGSYFVIFSAIDDSSAGDSEIVSITINEAGNQSPVLTAIGAQSTTENINLAFSVSATDPDATTPTLTTSSLPSGATFIDNGNGTGNFSWTPNFIQAGIYNITFYALDGALTDSEIVTITVTEAGNQTPVMSAIGAQSTTEGVLLSFGLSASDADSTIPAFSASTLPSGASFTDNGDGSATFDWTPDFVQSGIYNVTFYATDGLATDSEIVTITVNDGGNQLPILAAIGAQSTTENLNLNFVISASDPEGTAPSLTTSSLPAGASFVDNGNGTGTFDWIPDFTQSGSYNLTFYATDDSAAVDSEQVTITVIESGNQAPVLDPIGAKGSTEGVLLSFSLSASDLDATIPTLSAIALPSGANLIDNGNGTADFSWTPDFVQSGIYNVTFIADDGLAADSETITITISDAGNQNPVLATVGSRNILEGVNLNFVISAADPEGNPPTLTTSTLPSGATFIDNGDGTATFDWTPNFNQGGIYGVSFYATDDSSAVDSENVTITVTEAGNQIPVLAAIGPQSTSENVQLLFSISASDPDATTPTLSAVSLPSGAVFTDNGNGTGSFDWTPDFTQSGTYIVTFIASDGLASDSEIVSITVNEEGNQAPTLAAIGAKSVTEGANLGFTATATDLDGTTPSLSSSTLPGGASFTDNLNGTGTFDWTPTFIQAGSYVVTFYASDGALTDSEVVTITVNEAGNQVPVLFSIGSKATTEDIPLSFGISATDPDSTIPSLSALSLPGGATFIDNGDGTGTFDWTPNFIQGGIYNVTFIAADSLAADSEVVTITVTEAGNQPPVLATIGAQNIVEGLNLNFAVSASDPDSTTPTLTVSSLPSGASFTDNGNGSGIFDWTPDFTQAGTYIIIFRASDGLASDSEVVAITINEAGNQIPVLSGIGPRSTTEGVTLNFTVLATDADGTTPVISTSALPPGATFTDNLDGTADFDWLPTFTQSGSYVVTFYATDGAATDSEIVSITVNEAGNQIPQLDPIGAKGTTEGISLNFEISASDVDGTTPSLVTSTLPTGASFIDNGNGTGTFDWTPDFTQSGTYNVTFYASDGVATDSEVVTISVSEAGNQTPVLDPIGSKVINEGVNLNFGISASDPDGLLPSLATSALPAGAIFTDNGDGTGTFDWTPSFVQAGLYNITFFASDGAAKDSEIVSITVIEAGNQTPVLIAIGAKSATEGTSLNFGITASDPDSTIPNLSTSSLPAGAIFVNNGDGTGTFDWTPDFTQSGIYNVTFYATDGLATDSEQVTITIFEAGNQNPVLAAIGAQSVSEGSLLSFAVTASDPDGTFASLSTTALPAGASFADNLDGTGSFSWTPNFIQSGTYNVTFYATDGVATDSEVVSITVSEAGNQSPELFTIGAQNTTEGVNLNIAVSAADADSTTPTLTTSSLPTGASFTDNGDGSGVFDWTPDFTQSGTYNVTFYASDSLATDSEVVTIGVNEAGNQSPELAAIGAQSSTEGINLNFTVSSSDPDGSIPVLTTSSLPAGASFADNGDGSGTFDWLTDFTQSGTYFVTFRASDGVLLDSEVVTITILESGNQVPTLNPIGAKSVTEGNSLNFSITATDPDSTIPVLTTSSLPTGASFTDNGDGTADFNWTPNFIQAGSYNVTFYSSDGVATDSEVVTITVNEAGNQTPSLAAIGAQAINEGANLNLLISASDADSTIPFMSAAPLPAGATFTDNGDGTGTFDWTPDFTQSGTYNITFAASDGLAADSEVVTINVNESGNQAPVLEPIGFQSTTEDVSLNFNIAASDPDGTTPTLSTSSLPTGATFVDSGNGVGNFEWTPGFDQSGDYLVTFYATDGVATDSEIVQITVNEVGNQAPILTAIGAKNVGEGANLNFGVTASDADATTPNLSTSALPAGATFVDSLNGSGSFDWSPDFTQSGSYSITFYASDGPLTDSEVVTITVNDAGNQLPLLTAIGSQTTIEGTNLSFGLSAADVDGPSPVLTTSVLPIGATFVDNGDGTGNFDWTPGFTQSGTYGVTFYATDDSLAVDSEVVTISVNEAGNQSPVLATIGSKSVTEGANLSFSVSAVDPDSTTSALSTSTLPSGAVFIDSGNGSASFSWTPDFTQSGSYFVIFYATDGIATDSEIVSFTVNESGNQAPELTAIGSKSVTEGINLNFVVAATDPDGTTPGFSAVSLPAGATFIDNGDGTAAFDWTPSFVQSGVYNVTFLTTDGALSDSEIVTITVNEAGNQNPVLATIGSQTTTEGSNLNFSVSATDVDGATPSLSTSSLPTGAVFVDNGDGSGTFDWTPDFTQSGSYFVIFYASDGISSDSEIVSITVGEAGNQPPVLAAIGSKSVIEGNILNFGTSATDADGTTPVLSTSALPAGATFIDNGNGSGSFSWTPDFTQAGGYSITFYATDGFLTDSEVVIITVIEAGNQAPILTAIGAQSVNEGINLAFVISASDPDSTILALSTSALPTGATFVDNGDGSGSFDWTPDFTQAGTYSVTFRATDGLATDSEVVSITVNEAGNQTPVLAAIGAKSTSENVLLAFAISATDADGTFPTLTTSTLPTGAVFTDNGNGTGSFDWTPTFTQAGLYSVTFIASDTLVADSETVSIIVGEAGNQSPILSSIGSQSSSENVNLTFAVSATDPDGTTPVLTALNLPSGATFTDNGNGSGSFDWTPDFTQAGTYQVTFRASDGVLSDSEIVAVTIFEAGNQSPVLASIGAQSVTEGNNLNFVTTATDPDGTVPSFNSTTLPAGAGYTDNGDGSATFDWTPDFTQSGIYSITFYATDGSLTDSEVVTITVDEAGNQAPTLAAIGSKGTTENVNLSFAVSASDPDGTIPVLSTSSLPSGATFTDNANGSGSFDWTPDFTQSGTYSVTFYATDGIATDSEIVSITVNEEGNQAPVLATIGAQTTTENINLSFAVSAVDPDATTPVLTTSTLPSGASFTDNGNGSGSFDWTPTFIQSGSYFVIFYASDGVASDSEIVSITVNEAGNQPPVLSAIGAKATTEGINLNFVAIASDADSTIPVLTTSSLPTGATFIDNGDGTASFDWTPNFIQSGTYNVIFYASDGLATDSEVVTVTVTEAGNQAPLLSAIGAKATTEGINLNFVVAASDADSTIPVLSTSSLPSGATFTDNGNGTADFDWTPLFTQSGTYSVTFYATDGLLTDSEVVNITINEAGNQIPVLSSIGARTTTEGVSLNFNVSATDADSLIPLLSTSALPSGATFTDNGDGTGTFDWTPTFTQANSYFVIFIASDGIAADSEIVSITVNEAGNQSPLLAAIGAKSTAEGNALNFDIAASDPDGTTPTLSALTLPAGATFTDNGNGSGSFEWIPNFTQAGIYSVTFIAADGSLADSEVVTITVNEAGNQTPLLSSIGSKGITEGVNLNFSISATDADATIPTLSTSALPAGATFVDNGDGTADFDWTPNFTQSGTYNVTFYASDGVLSDSEVVTITVNDAGNQRPLLSAIGAQSSTEGLLLTFAAAATDPDGTTPSINTGTLPSGAIFTDNGDGSGTFSWTTTFTQAGIYNILFIAADGVLSDSETVQITILESGNQTPVLSSIGAKFVNEGANLNFSITATDPDGTTPSFSNSVLPAGVTFTDNGDGSATFDWTPDFTQAGSYNITFRASDGALTDSEVVTITVTESGNQAPLLTLIGAKSVTEGLNLNFSVSASDPDATIPALSTTNLPTGASFVDNGDGSATFDWTPDFTQSGTYNVTFIASDGLLADSEVVTISVSETGNQIPQLSAIGPQATTEDINLSFSVTATDPDGTIPTLLTSTLPSGAIFTDNGDGSGNFSWTPDFTQSGTYNVTFYA